jgi:short-subunit dehydrogenase
VRAPFQKALVTGAAGDLGSRLARGLARRGVDLVLLDCARAPLERLASELRSSVSVSHQVADQTDLDRFDAIVAAIAEQHRDVDLLVANAGIDKPQALATLDWRLAKKHFDVHALSNYVLLAAFVPHFLERDAGHVAAIVSLGALVGCPYAHAYNASKSALRMMMDGMRAETRATGVTWTSVFPGFLEGTMAAGNAWRQPYRIPMDTAAERILEGIVARKRIVAFPLRAVLQVRLVDLLPAVLRDRMVASSMKAGDELERGLAATRRR